MKRIISAKFLAAGAIALGAFVAASAANAGSDVHFSIGVNSPIPSTWSRHRSMYSRDLCTCSRRRFMCSPGPFTLRLVRCMWTPADLPRSLRPIPE